MEQEVEAMTRKGVLSFEQLQMGRGITVVPGMVRYARQKAGLSLERLAEPELTKGLMWQIEQGKVRPSLSTLCQIASRTGRSIEFFLPGEEMTTKILCEVVLKGRRLSASVVGEGEPVSNYVAAAMAVRGQSAFGDAIIAALGLTSEPTTVYMEGILKNEKE